MKPIHDVLGRNEEVESCILILGSILHSFKIVLELDQEITRRLQLTKSSELGHDTLISMCSAIILR
jgi:hypothetical protein